MNNLYIPLSGVANVPATEKFDRVLQRSERQFDRINIRLHNPLQKMKRTGQDAYLSSDEEFEEALVQALDREEKKEKLLTHAVMPDRTFNEVHRATMEKLKRLKEVQEVKTVKYIWECQWKKRFTPLSCPHCSPEQPGALSREEKPLYVGSSQEGSSPYERN